MVQLFHVLFTYLLNSILTLFKSVAYSIQEHFLVNSNQIRKSPNLVVESHDINHKISLFMMFWCAVGDLMIIFKPLFGTISLFLHLLEAPSPKSYSLDHLLTLSWFPHISIQTYTFHPGQWFPLRKTHTWRHLYNSQGPLAWASIMGILILELWVRIS